MAQTNSVRDLETNLRRSRAEKILDAAGELLLRYGYKRITIDDIAAAAGVGKGTIYLHWKTRDDLFDAVIAREYAEVMDEMLEVIRQDPQSLLMNRAVRWEFLAVMRRPILRALFTGDMELMGSLTSGGVNRELNVQLDQMFLVYLSLLHEQGLLRQDLTPLEHFYAWQATCLGFFLNDPFSSEQFPFDLEKKADLLADTLKHAFEIESESSREKLLAILPRMTALIEEIIQKYQVELQKAYE